MSTITITHCKSNVTTRPLEKEQKRGWLGLAERSLARTWKEEPLGGRDLFAVILRITTICFSVIHSFYDTFLQFCPSDWGGRGGDKKIR